MDSIETIRDRLGIDLSKLEAESNGDNNTTNANTASIENLGSYDVYLSQSNKRINDEMMGEQSKSNGEDTQAIPATSAQPRGASLMTPRRVATTTALTGSFIKKKSVQIAPDPITTSNTTPSNTSKSAMLHRNNTLSVTTTRRRQGQRLMASKTMVDINNSNALSPRSVATHHHNASTTSLGNMLTTSGSNGNTAATATATDTTAGDDTDPMDNSARSKNWRSQALFLEVRLKELLKLKTSPKPNEFIVSQFLQTFDILGEVLPPFQPVFDIMRSELELAIYSDTLTSNISTEGDKAVIEQVPYFSIFLQMEKEREFRQAEERMSQQVNKVLHTEATIAKLTSELEKTKAELFQLKITNENLAAKIKMMEKDSGLQKSVTDETYKALEKKYNKLLDDWLKLHKTKKELEEYKERMESIYNEYESIKRDKSSIKEMFVAQTEKSVLYELFTQLEMLENRLIDTFEADSITKSSGEMQTCKNRFSRDMDVLLEEMRALQDKIGDVKRREAKIAKSKRINLANIAAGNHFVAPLRDIDREKFSTYLEVHIARPSTMAERGREFELLMRSTAMNRHEPKRLHLPKGTTDIQVLFTKPEHALVHPNPDESGNVEHPRAELEKREQKVPRTLLWSVYRERFGTHSPLNPRIIKLSKLRQFIYQVYKRHFIKRSKQTGIMPRITRPKPGSTLFKRATTTTVSSKAELSKLSTMAGATAPTIATNNIIEAENDHTADKREEEMRRAANDNKNHNDNDSDYDDYGEEIEEASVASRSTYSHTPLQVSFFEVLEDMFLLPEVVMKVAYENMASIDHFKDKYADIAEFALCLSDKSDAAPGMCMSLALVKIKQLWPIKVKEHEELDRSEMLQILRNIYHKGITESERERIYNELCEETKEKHIISKVNKYFIENLRDVTEYWCKKFVNKVMERSATIGKNHFREPEFLVLASELFPQVPREKLLQRYGEACSVLGKQTGGLDAKTLAYMFAEFKWLEVDNPEITW